MKSGVAADMMAPLKENKTQNKQDEEGTLQT